jgi:hypothetical protein
MAEILIYVGVIQGSNLFMISSCSWIDFIGERRKMMLPSYATWAGKWLERRAMFCCPWKLMSPKEGSVPWATLLGTFP